MNNGKTVGAQVLEHSLKKHSADKVLDLQRATEKEYIKELEWAVKHARGEIDCAKLKGHSKCSANDKLTGDFFIECKVKKEKFLPNTLRNYFITRKSCPTPDFDQTIYRYNHSKEQIEFIWVVPDIETCEIYSHERNKVVPAEYDLLSNVLKFKNGELLQISKKFNKEIAENGCALKDTKLIF